VQAAQRALLRAERVVGLDERGGEAVRAELLPAEEAREESALVGALLELDQMRAGERGLEEAQGGAPG
jgi:hypothetical protein